jgi:hypothetical protein
MTNSLDLEGIKGIEGDVFDLSIDEGVGCLLFIFLFIVCHFSSLSDAI